MGNRNEKNKEIASFIGSLSTDRAVTRLLAFSLGRVLSNSAGDDFDPSDVDFNAARHIRDWIVAALANREQWLSRVDNLGRPKKLLKFSTVEDITKEADKAMLRHAQKSRGVRLREGDEELVMELPDGYSVVRLLTQQALDRESAEVQHCIGNGGYDDLLTKQDVLFLSLRDVHGKAHVTMHIEGAEAVEVQGKQNCPPNKEYLEALAPFFRDTGYAIRRAANWDYVYVDDYRVVDANDLSGCTKLIGDLIRCGSPITMPDNLHVTGNVVLEDCTFSKGFPHILTSDGNIIVRKCCLPLPKEIRAKGYVTITKSDVKGEIDVLFAGGAVILSSSNFTQLPKTLNFSGKLSLNETGITDVEGLAEVDGDLDISHTEIRKLPDGLIIKGCLQACASKLERYPVSAVIGKSVDVSNTMISELPSVDVNGALNISATPIKAIPGNLRANILSATSMHIENFSARVDIKYALDLSYSTVRLPAGLKVGRLHLKSASINHLPDNLEAATINASGARLATIGSGLKVFGDLILNGTQITKLPNDMEVGGIIQARQTLLRELPDGFVCKNDLDMTGSEIESLPKGMKVGGWLTLHENDISTLPVDLSVGQSLVITHTGIREIPDSVSIGRTVHSDIPELDTGSRRLEEVKNHSLIASMSICLLPVRR